MMRIKEGIRYLKSLYVAFITVFPSVEAVAGLRVAVTTINYSRIGNFNESLRFDDARSWPATCRSPDGPSLPKPDKERQI